MQEAEANGDTAKAKACDDQLGFLTPILKGFLTEMGKEAADHGMQVWGGHGYIKDNGLEQVYRDVRISSLWEGTTQIQALDLLGRKVLLQKLKPINEHGAKLRAACAPLLLNSDAQLRSHARRLYFAAIEWQYLTYRTAARAGYDSKDAISAASVDYLLLGGYVSLAHHWLQMEATAVKALADPASAREEAAFYHAKCQTSAYVFDRLLPRTRYHKEAILAPTDSLMAMRVEDFSFDHSQ